MSVCPDGAAKLASKTAFATIESLRQFVLSAMLSRDNGTTDVGKEAELTE